MKYVTLQPGDATLYTCIYDRIDDRVFFAFNAGDNGPLIGFLWPAYLDYISWGYFIEKQGHKLDTDWTRGIAYLVLMKLLGLVPGPSDLEKGSLPFIAEEGRLKNNWLDQITREGDD